MFLLKNEDINALIYYLDALFFEAKVWKKNTFRKLFVYRFLSVASDAGLPEIGQL
jgi:hypothetical protein